MSHEQRDYIEQLHQHGYRVTSQRLIVLDAVCEVGGHASIESIVRRVGELDSTIDQSTIYRALEVLANAKLIASSEIDGVRVYEIVDNTPHHHLVCRVCGNIQQLNHDMIQPCLHKIQLESGFQVEQEHLILSGLCSKCRK